MSWLHMQMVLLDAATAIVGFGINWFLQSTLLVIIGLATARLLAPRGAAVQSAIYRTTLVAVLLCPIASWLLASAGVSGWSLAMPRPWTYVPAETTAAVAALPAPESPAPGVATGIDSVMPTPSPDSGAELQSALAAQDISSSPGSIPSMTEGPSPVANQRATAEPEIPLASTSTFSVHHSGLVAVGLGAAWLLICAALLARLATAWWRLSRLRDSAVHADAVTVETCRELAARFRVAAPEVLRSPYLPSPCLAGLRRPVVLLPECELCLSVRDVLIHELAHLARRDCHWNLLRQLGLSVLFFQPLLWRLSRRLEATAEEVCDDYVVQFGGDRQEYAHRLVDIAELSTAPMAAAGVGIVSLRSMLAQRVQRIMDTSRSLSTRVGSLLLTLVLVGGIVGTTIVGLVGIGPKKSVAESTTEQVDSEAAPAENETADSDSGTKNERETKDNPAAAEATVKEPDDDPITVRGRVLDPDGKPVDGATVRLVRWYWNPHIEHKPLNEVKSDSAGKFKITYRKSQFDIDVARSEQWKEVAVSAFKQGYGTDWSWPNRLPRGEQAELRLPLDDLPITGRLLDLEGQPLAGVRVKCGELHAPKGDDDLSAWIEAVKRGEPAWTAAKHLRNGLPSEGSGLPSDLVTDADGRFRLTSIGRERTIRLVFEGSTVARTTATVVTRPMSPISQTKSTLSDSKETTPVLGADFVLNLPPTRAIEGVVRDAATGQVLSGVEVESWRYSGSNYVGERHLRVVTDEQGRFKLLGMPKGPGNEIIAIPNDDEPYFMRSAKVPDDPGLEPVTVDIELHRGIWITGRVTDQVTGQAVRRARLYYLPFLTNQFAQSLSEFDANGNVEGTFGYQDRYLTAADGNYRLVGLPGRAIIGVQAIENSYRKGLGAEAIEGMDKNGHFPTYRNPVNPGKAWPTAMKEINPAEEATSVAVDFQLDPGKKIEFETLDPAGQPLTDVAVTGLTPSGYQPPTSSSKVVATGFSPKEERTILFHHEQRKLGKAVRVHAADAEQQTTIKLEPCATIRGRLVDQNQVPVTGAEIRIDVLPSEDFGKRLNSTTTDAEGRFEHTAILPGASYTILAEGHQIDFRTVAKEVAVEPGDTIDLGTIDVTGDERPKPVRTKAAQSAPVSQESKQTKQEVPAMRREPHVQVSGQITLASGKPAVGAHVAVIANTLQGRRGGDLQPYGAILAEGEVDASGHYQMNLKGVSSKTHNEAQVIVRKDGYAIAWRQLNLDATTTDLSFTLVPEVPIRGQLVNIEGQPAAGVRLTILSNTPMSKGNDEHLDEQDRVRYDGGDNAPAAWLQSITSDNDGRFTLHSVPDGHRVCLVTTGSDRFAHQSIVLNSGMPEQRGEKDGTYRSLVKNAAPDEEIVLPLAPAQIFEGVVTYEDTGEPAPHARLTIWASEEEEFGSMIGEPGKADAEGRYRISPWAGIRFGITAYPPDGAPYLVKETPYEEAIHWKTGDRVKQINLKLRRGVLARGTVVEEGTNAPVAGASIQYDADQLNPLATDDVLTGWQGIQLSDPQGKFEMVVLPGPGRLLVHVQGGKYILQQILTKSMNRGPNERRQYAHAIDQIDPAPNADPLELSISLKPGATITGKIVDETGAEVDEALVISRLNISPYSPWWRGPTPSTLGGKFELSGLEQGQQYTTYFLDAKRRIGATQVFRADSTDSTVVLKPCGQASARFVDSTGKPHVGHVPIVFMVVGPEKQHPDWEAVSLGKQGADEDFLANVDQTNHWTGHKTDEQGRAIVPALIPGAIYRFITIENGEQKVLKQFSVESGEQLDLGDISVNLDQ